MRSLFCLSPVYTVAIMHRLSQLLLLSHSATVASESSWGLLHKVDMGTEKLFLFKMKFYKLTQI